MKMNRMNIQKDGEFRKRLRLVFLKFFLAENIKRKL